MSRSVSRRTWSAFGAVLICLLGLVVAGAQPASADQSRSGSCSVTFNGTTYHGANTMYYYTYNTAYFSLDYDTYKFGPASSGSIHNNQNIYFWGGSKSDSESSADNLRRDNVTHTDQTQADWGSITGQVGNSYVNFRDIFDVPDVSDPHCDATTGYF